MKIKHNILTLVITIVTMLSLTGCEDTSKLGSLDKGDEVYKNNYFNFTVTQKLNYTFIDNEDTTTNMGNLELRKLFKLVDEDTNDVVEGYYTEIKDSIDKTVEEFVSYEDSKEGAINKSDIFKNGEYLSVDFTNDSTSYRVSFKEMKDYCLIFLMTYKSEQDK
ncbi:hypothetical protein, partial [Intestinibacter sp.]